MTVESFNSGQPPPEQINGKDAQPSKPVTAELEPLLHALLAMCGGLETATFRMTLRDRQTEQDTFSEQGHPMKLLGYLPECLSRLWHWNETLIIESCDPVQNEDLDVEG